MILQEEDIIRKNVKNEEFDRKMSELKDRYLEQVYSSYMFFSFEDKQESKRLVFNTNPDWQKNYIDCRLIDNCPLYAATILSPLSSAQKGFLFLWNQIAPGNDKQREVMDIRTEHGIANGLSITKQVGNYRVMLGLGSDPRDRELEENYATVLPKIITLFAAASSICLSRDEPTSEVAFIQKIEKDFSICR